MAQLTEHVPKRGGFHVQVARYAALALFPHHVEHLIPLCEILDAPLISVGQEADSAARSVYPFSNIVTIDVAGKDWAAIAFDPALRKTLALFDVIAYSHLLQRNELRAVFGTLGNTPPRVIFCPHGFSEKKQQWSAAAAYQDISIFYGPLGLEQLSGWGVSEALGHHLLTGNLRYPYYIRHRKFFDDLMRKRGVAVAASSDPTVLYAPTWNDSIGSSSFCDLVGPLVRGLPHGWRLLIKPHPLLEESITEDVFDLIRNHENVTLLTNLPLTYPILERADVYVGDMSSLAYDFLIYEKPMIFLNQNAGNDADPRETRLLQCGSVLSPGDYSRVYEFIVAEITGAATYSERKRKLYEQVYSSAESPSALRGKLDALVAGPPPLWMFSRSPTTSTPG